MSASSFATERASPGARVVCDCYGVLFERWYLDIEELQTHHIWQIIFTYKRCRVTNIRVQAPTTALLAESRQLAEKVRNCTFLYLVDARFHVHG